MIEIKNLTYKIDSNIILDDINLSIKKQDFIIFIGPNGGGKSTFLKLILKLINNYSGSISYSKNLAFGYVPQNHQANNINYSLPISVLEFAKLGIHKTLLDRFKSSISSKDLNTKAIDAIKKVGLADKIHSQISSLSGGQLQKAMIARAISSSPDVLILDEPTSNIDLQGVNDIFNLLESLNKEGITILLVNHDSKTTFTYAKTIAHIDKVLTTHQNDNKELKDLLDSSSSHFCEVEFVKLLKQAHTTNCNTHKANKC